MSPAVVRRAGRQARSFGERMFEWLFGRGRELPLQADGIAIALAALLGVMVYLAALGLASSGVLHGLAQRWEYARAGEFTVEVRPLSSSGTVGAPSLTARVTAVLQSVRATPGVAKATPLGEGEMRRLLTPWLGEEVNFQDLPLPVLITVEMKPGEERAIEGIAERLTRAVPGVKVDDHGEWLKELKHFVEILQIVTLAVILLLGFAATLTVVLVTRISLLAHRDVVDILHVMGATDRHIAWQFQTFVARIAVVGSAGGAILAFVTVLVAQLFGLALSAPLLPETSLPWWFFAVILMLPLPTVLLAVFVARRSVLWWVRKLP